MNTAKRWHMVRSSKEIVGWSGQFLLTIYGRPGCYKYWFDTVCDHISGVVSGLIYPRHDVIRALFPYHYTGI